MKNLAGLVVDNCDVLVTLLPLFGVDVAVAAEADAPATLAADEDEEEAVIFVLFVGLLLFTIKSLLLVVVVFTDKDETELLPILNEDKGFKVCCIFDDDLFEPLFVLFSLLIFSFKLFIFVPLIELRFVLLLVLLCVDKLLLLFVFAIFKDVAAWFLMLTNDELFILGVIEVDGLKMIKFCSL